MRILGISVGTIALVLLALYIGKKYGGSLPLLKSL